MAIQNIDGKSVDVSDYYFGKMYDGSDVNVLCELELNSEKKVFELSQKLHEAKQALEQEKEIEKQKNQQEIVKLLTKKNLDSIPLSKWKEHLKEIEKLLNS